MADRDTVVALLAAGMGRRFGGGKLDQDLGGKPVGCWAASAAQAADFSRRIIITPPAPPAFVSRLVGWERVINPGFESGMASSIRAAAIAAQGHKRLIIVLADMPFVEADHLDRLASGDKVAFTLYPSRRKGVPAGFPAEVFSALMYLPDDHSPAGLDWKTAVDAFEPRSVTSLMDIDTEDDLAVARSAIGNRG